MNNWKQAAIAAYNQRQAEAEAKAAQGEAERRESLKVGARSLLGRFIDSDCWGRIEWRDRGDYGARSHSVLFTVDGISFIYHELGGDSEDSPTLYPVAICKKCGATRGNHGEIGMSSTLADLGALLADPPALLIPHERPDTGGKCWGHDGGDDNADDQGSED